VTAATLQLDDDGLLRPEAFDELSAGPSYLVFAQQPDVRVDVAAWQAHAQRFFGSDLHLSMPKRYGAVAPRVDGAHVTLIPRGADAVHRLVFLRARTDEDLAAATAATGGYGLAELVKRCPTVVLVKLEGEPDRAGVLLAALVSSVSFGPILTPDRTQILGPRSARALAAAS
jgi:hypothetical protein